MKTLKLVLAAIFVAGITLILNSCGGTGEPYDPYVPDAPPFELASNTVLPGQMVIIRSSEELQFDSYNAVFGDSSITLNKDSDSNELFFIVPTFSPGTYVLEINDNDISETFNILISNYTPIQDVQKVVDDYSSNLKASVSGLKDLIKEGWNIDAENIALLESINSEYEALLSNMTQPEKEHLAYFIQSNGLSDFQTPTIRFNDSLYRGTTPPEELKRLKIEFTVTMGTAASLVGLIAKLIATPEGIITKIAAVGAAGLLVHEVITLVELSERIGKLAAIPNKLSEELETFIVNGDKDIEFQNKVPKVVTSKMQFRGIKKGDQSYSEGFISQLAVSMEEFNVIWNKANDFINKVKSIFGVNVKEIKGTPKSLPATPRTLEHYPDPNNLSIENVSASDVKLTSKIADKGLEVTVEAEKEVEFTFDLVYKLDGFEEVRKSFSATVVDMKKAKFIDPRDNQKYDIVTIGNQTWFAENLRFNTKYSYELADTFGHSYIFEEAENACPVGWHLPSKVEWETLINYVGGKDVAGEKLQSVSYGWHYINEDADEFGFSAVGGGLVAFKSKTLKYFDKLWQNSSGNYWSSTVNQSDSLIFSVELIRNQDKIYTHVRDKHYQTKYFLIGRSIRCIKD